MKTRTMMCALVLLLASFTWSFSCTTVSIIDANGLFVGFNLDYSNYNPKIWFIPASEGEYGRFCYGFDKQYRTAEGGMNEKGLFIAVNALNKDAGWKADKALTDWEKWDGWLETGVPDGILAKCATVDEAVMIFRTYNLFTLNRVKFLLADKTGASVVVEWANDGLAVTERKGDYQIATNFVAANYTKDKYPCGRYAVADLVLSREQRKNPIDKIRAALSAAHLEFQTPTVLSVICDLGKGNIWLYFFHNYEEVVNRNLFQELSNGGSRHEAAKLFKINPYVADVYRQYVK